MHLFWVDYSKLCSVGVIVVATSNRIPDELYQGGLNRHRFLPFIDLLRLRVDVLYLDSPTDYRLDELKGYPSGSSLLVQQLVMKWIMPLYAIKLVRMPYALHSQLKVARWLSQVRHKGLHDLNLPICVQLI